MHSMNVKLKALFQSWKQRHGKRLSALALTVAIMAGTLLAFPTVAYEQTEVTDTAEATQGAVCTFKMLQSNLEALEAATAAYTTVYTGDIVSLYNVTVLADGEQTVLCVPAGTTVSEAVKAANITLGEQDKLSIDGARFVTDLLEVSVIRVGHKEYQKTYSISYTTEVRYTSELRQGASKVLQAGKAGVRTVTYRDRVENGKVVSTEQVKEEITTQPTKKIILKGTKVGKVVSEAPFDIALDSAGQPLNYKKKLTGKCTAYTTDRGDSGAWTSTGKRAQVGIVAVDPRVIPYGTKLWIVSADGKIVYGYAVAGDTGGAAKSGKIIADLFFDTYGECEKFGRRTMNVYIIG